MCSNIFKYIVIKQSNQTNPETVSHHITYDICLFKIYLLHPLQTITNNHMSKKVIEKVLKMINLKFK